MQCACNAIAFSKGIQLEYQWYTFGILLGCVMDSGWNRDGKNTFRGGVK